VKLVKRFTIWSYTTRDQEVAENVVGFWLSLGASCKANLANILACSLVQAMS